MKTGIFSLATLSLLQLALSQPHARKLNGIAVDFARTNSFIGHQHRHHEEKRSVDVVTVEAPAKIVVYVDQHGKPASTKTLYDSETPPTKAPEPIVKTPHPAPNPAPAPVPKPKEATYQAPKPKPAAPKPAAPKPAAPVPKPKPAPEKPKSSPAQVPAPNAKYPNPSPVQSGPGFSSGISYSPYNEDNSCKSSSQVAQDLAAINGFSVIRLYGTDCDQIANVLAATKDKGISLFLGIYDITQVSSEVQKISDAVHSDWHLVNTVSVGNELVNQGKASVGQVTAAISQARDALKAAGYQGPVVTVDTMVAIKANPELCHASDYCAINCHAFFDGNVLPEGAGDFVQLWVDQVSSAAGGKTVVITETGWPTQGSPNNKAIPSKENQNTAIASIVKKLGKNVIQYNAYNDLWKKDSGATHGAERYWGIYGNAPSQH